MNLIGKIVSQPFFAAKTSFPLIYSKRFGILNFSVMSKTCGKNRKSKEQNVEETTIRLTTSNLLNLCNFSSKKTGKKRPSLPEGAVKCSVTDNIIQCSINCDLLCGKKKTKKKEIKKKKSRLNKLNPDDLTGTWISKKCIKFDFKCPGSSKMDETSKKETKPCRIEDMSKDERPKGKIYPPGRIENNKIEDKCKVKEKEIIKNDKKEKDGAEECEKNKMEKEQAIREEEKECLSDDLADIKKQKPEEQSCESDQSIIRQCVEKCKNMLKGKKNKEM